MSASRTQWDDSEELLLRQVFSEMPEAALHQIWQAFDRQNYQQRTKNAVKAKIKDLKLSVERGQQAYPVESAVLRGKGHDEVALSTPSEEQRSNPSRHCFQVSFLA